MCRSEPQIAVVVTLTIASRGLRIAGSGTVSTRIFSLPSQHTARIVDSLPARRSRNLASLEQLLEVAEVFADRLRRLTAEQPGDERAALSGGRRVLQMDGHLRTAATVPRIEVHGSGRHDIRVRKRAPRQDLILDLVDDLGVPFHAQPTGSRGDPVRAAVRVLRHALEIRHEPRQPFEMAP